MFTQYWKNTTWEAVDIPPTSTTLKIKRGEFWGNNYQKYNFQGAKSGVYPGLPPLDFNMPDKAWN